MTLQTQFDRPTAFLLNLELLSPRAVKDAFTNEALETGGSVTAPNAGSHLHEIQLHGITASGGTENEAIRNWRKAAHATLAPQDAA